MGYRIFFTSVMVLSLFGCSSDSDNDVLADSGDLEQVDAEDTVVEVSTEADPLDDAADVSAPLRSLDDVGFEMIADLAGYKADQLAGVVPDLGTLVIDQAIGSPEVLPGGGFLTNDSLEGGVITETERTLYQCSAGGTFIFETGTLQLDFTNYSRQRVVNRYDFDQCQFLVFTDRVVMGLYSANGTLTTSDSTLTQRRSEEITANREWTTFDLMTPEAVRYEVDGSNDWRILTGAGGAFESRQSNLIYYRKTQGDTIINQVNDSRLEMDLSVLGGDNENTMDIQFSGSFEDERSAGQVITINTPNPMTFSASEQSQLLHSGGFEVQSSDSRFLSGDALSSGNRLNPSLAPLAGWTSTDADGNVTSGITALGSFGAEIPVCESDSTEPPILCDDGSFRYVLP